MKKKTALLMSILMILMTILPTTNAYATSSVKVQSYNVNRVASTGNICFSYNLVNTGTTGLNLSDVKLKYYFTNDGSQSDNFACDYSSIGSGNVTGVFGNINATNADKFLEIGFNSNAGTLAVGESVVVNVRVWKSDWSAFTQTNDYSYNSLSDSYVESTSVTGYINNTLAWGAEPEVWNTETATPIVSPTVVPTIAPTVVPTVVPTVAPTIAPTVVPTAVPTIAPTVTPVTFTTPFITFFNGNREPSTNYLSLSFNLENTGTTDLNLSTIKMRYYFTNDGSQTDNFACDYSSAGTSNVTGTFGTVNAADADKYVEIGFSNTAGTLAAGKSIVVYARVWKSDWSNFIQTNDYSYHASAASFVQTSTVTGYVNDKLTSGAEPDGTIVATTTPTVTPTVNPTATPVVTPTVNPTATPAVTPTVNPTATPAVTPTVNPTATPIVTPTPDPTQTSSKVLLIGRMDTSDPAGPKFSWSNSTIKANFTGTGISVNLKSVGDNYFAVIIDGVVKTPINVSPSTTSPITLASGLTNGTHTIELVKRTEASVGEVQFLGFTVKDGELLDPPAASSKRIMFIGDSISCAYGNEGTSQYQSFTTKNENAYLSYTAITARLLGADLMNISWSGKGVYSNYGGNKVDLMPEIYQRILPYNSTLLWDESKWTPQVIVINLGTNDFSTGTPDNTLFSNAYSTFIGKIRSQYPNAEIYCAIGPMLWGDGLTNARTCINNTVMSKIAAGDQNIHFIEFPAQDSANGYGEDWHPSIKTHEIMAQQITAQIQTDLGW